MNEIELQNIIEKPIRIIGVGGAGNNVIEKICDSNLEHACCIQLDTDVNIRSSRKAFFVQLGRKKQHGLGTGANPDLGEAAAIESAEDIAQILYGAKKAIITCGMGQGTGTGASPVVARIAKKMGITVSAIINTPFAGMEGEKRTQMSQQGVEKLKESVSSLTIISIEHVLQQVGTGVRLHEFFNTCDRAMCDAIYKALYDEEMEKYNNTSVSSIGVSDEKV